MNWFTFITWIAGLYLAYYLSLILYDYTRSRRPAAAASAELTFSEDIQPQKIGAASSKPENPPKPASKQGSAIIASGGVSLKNLFNLCREEAIIYTRPVSF